jgi:hypothetical protein
MAKSKPARNAATWCLAGVALGLAVLSGCQTNVAGMTLPSGYYLQHPPQYIPQTPRFPLPRELDQQETVANAPGANLPPAQPLPPPIPGGAPQMP